jgi:hypothetical protein
MFAQRWSASFDCTASWSAHNDGIVLSSIITHAKSDGFCLITGGNDGYIKVCEAIIMHAYMFYGQIKVWEISPPQTRDNVAKFTESLDGEGSRGYYYLSIRIVIVDLMANQTSWYLPCQNSSLYPVLAPFHPIVKIVAKLPSGSKNA